MKTINAACDTTDGVSRVRLKFSMLSRWKACVFAFLCLAAVFCACPARAAVKLPSIISAGMVVQRERVIPIWGTAERGEPVTVIFGDEKVGTTADEQGKWFVKLPPMQAGGPFTLTVKGTNTITMKNVMVGDVWLVSGQSNMGMSVKQALYEPKDVLEANYPKIHLYTLDQAVSPKPMADAKGEWVECTPKNVESFSAVGYYFGREVYEHVKVPIGLINCCYAGAVITTWASEEGWNATPELKSIISKSNDPNESFLLAKDRYQREYSAWEVAAEAAKAKGEAPPMRPIVPVTLFAPSSIFNAMVAPIVPYGLRGVLWYQGESDTGRAVDYAKLFPALIQDWRKQWRRPDLPFIFVQLPNFAKKAPEPAESPWAELREAQMLCRRIPYAFMAVAIDTSHEANVDIHPKEKKEIGHRLALIALATQYKMPKAFSGPIFDSVQFQGNQAKVTFRYADGGLTSKGGPLKGFEIAGSDRKFFNANAQILGNEVLVSSDKVEEPVAVRYAWADNPFVSLYNSDDLPAAPFRTDRWVKRKISKKP